MTSSPTNFSLPEEIPLSRIDASDEDWYSSLRHDEQSSQVYCSFFVCVSSIFFWFRKQPGPIRMVLHLTCLVSLAILIFFLGRLSVHHQYIPSPRFGTDTDLGLALKPRVADHFGYVNSIDVNSTSSALRHQSAPTTLVLNGPPREFTVELSGVSVSTTHSSLVVLLSKPPQLVQSSGLFVGAQFVPPVTMASPSVVAVTAGSAIKLDAQCENLPTIGLHGQDLLALSLVLESELPTFRLRLLNHGAAKCLDKTTLEWSYKIILRLSKQVDYTDAQLNCAVGVTIAPEFDQYGGQTQFDVCLESG